jgi:type VI secretion system protein ImpK
MSMNSTPKNAAESAAGAPERAFDTVAAASSLLTQVMLNRASELARAGEYAEAEAVLGELIREPEPLPRALDLLARIRAQQGRLLEAQSLWTRAAALDPTNRDYPAALNRISAIQRRPRWLGLSAPLLAGLVVALTIVGAGLLVSRSIDSVVDNSERRDDAIATEQARQGQEISSIVVAVQGVRQDTLDSDDAIATAVAEQGRTLVALQQKVNDLATAVAADKDALSSELAAQRTVLNNLSYEIGLLSTAIDSLIAGGTPTPTPTPPP